VRLARLTRARRGLGLGACSALALCAAQLLAPGALAAGGPAARAAATPRLLGGLNIIAAGSPAEADRAIAGARRAKVRLVRADVNWSTLEPDARGQIDAAALARVDHLAAVAAHDHIKIVMTVGSSPCWATTAPAKLLGKCRPGLVTKASAFPPSDNAAYAAFVAFLARRYAPQLAAIEVWNEPDQANERYFGGPDKVNRYAALLRAAYPAIKAAAPGVTVLGGSLVGFNGLFLKALYAAGIKGFYDGLSVHYYTLTLAALRQIHETQVANGDRTPLWLDEFGWGSCWPRRGEQEQPCTTAGVQAANVTSMFQALNGTPYVAAAILFKLADSGREHFGVFTDQGRPKPSFKALKKVMISGATRAPRPKLRLSARGGRVLARGSGPVGDFMVLEAFQGSALRYRANFVLDRFDRFSLGLPAVLGTHLRVRVYQFAAGRAGAVQRSI
jgi:hypothetical protein